MSIVYGTVPEKMHVYVQFVLLIPATPRSAYDRNEGRGEASYLDFVSIFLGEFLTNWTEN